MSLSGAKVAKKNFYGIFKNQTAFFFVFSFGTDLIWRGENRSSSEQIHCIARWLYNKTVMWKVVSCIFMSHTIANSWPSALCDVTPWFSWPLELTQNLRLSLKPGDGNSSTLKNISNMAGRFGHCKCILNWQKISPSGRNYTMKRRSPRSEPWGTPGVVFREISRQCHGKLCQRTKRMEVTSLVHWPVEMERCDWTEEIESRTTTTRCFTNHNSFINFLRLRQIR